MNPTQHLRLQKNIRQWTARIDKLENLEERKGRTRTPDEDEELEYRVNMVKLWNYELKNAKVVPGDNPSGDMSATASSVATESAKADEG